MEDPHERFVIPVAGTSADDRILSMVPNLIVARHASLTLLYVVAVAQSMPLDAELPDEITRGEAALAHAESMARQLLGGKRVQLHTELLQARSIGAAVVDEAIERNADAIVMASSIRRRHGRPTLGETVNYIMLNAPCDVIALRIAPNDLGQLESSWR